MEKIEILVSCHMDSYVPENNIIKSIQVGASKKKHLENVTYFDDDGDSISEKNDKYCEMTAQYWAWKNIDLDYYGFCHYRRYLSFHQEKQKADQFKNVTFDFINENFIKTFGLDEESIREFIGDYDIIVPEPMDVSVDQSISKHEKNIYSHYKHSINHNIEDYDFCLKYIKNNYPEFIDAATKYNKSKYSYFLNSYVLKKEIFFGYCEWLFPILNAFDEQKDYTLCNVQETRAAGFLAERLFGIYLTHLKDTNPKLRIKETQQSLVLDASNPYPTPKKENSIVVCLGCDDYYVPLAGNVINSIMLNSSPQDFYDVFVVTNCVTEFSKEELLKLQENYVNLSIRFINGNAFLGNKSLYEKQHINKSTYLRFAMLDFLKNYDKAIYLDCDLVVNKDLAELYNTDIEGYFLSAIRDSVQSGWCKRQETEQFQYNKNILKLENAFDYFNAGVLLINLNEIRKHYTADDLYKIARSYKWKWQDQDILNHIARGKIKFLSESWNVMVHAHRSVSETPEYSAPKQMFEAYMKARANPYIVHYVGRNIPCFTNDSDLFYYFWKYARQSIFYEKLLFMMAENKSGKTKTPEKSLIRRIGNKLFPKDSKRRAFVKKLISPFKRKSH